MRVDEVQALMARATPDEHAALMKILAEDKAIWRPLPGPQSQAYHATADVVGYGGAAGGGKTDLACGKALTQHRKIMILRREGTQLTGIIDRLTELIGHRDGYNGQDKIWRLGKRQIEFGSTPNLGDETKYQGRPHDLLVFDEATNFLEQQVRFLLGWLRTTIPGQHCQALLTFNPPTTAEGRWVIAFFAPWLDDKHPNPARPGELRWFATIDGEEREVETGAHFEHDGEIIEPQSRTFVPSRVGDNPYLTGTGYMAQLQSLPEPLRSQMLKGDFRAGLEDDPWQVIPTVWVDLAMERWERRQIDKKPMDSMGVDVARGGKDETIIFRRHGSWFDEAVVYPGVSTPDGPTLMAHVLAARRDRAPVHIDIVGWGASPYDFLVQNDIQTIGINGANKSGAYTADAGLTLVNKRAEIWWRMREALDPKSLNPVALPSDNKLRADLCAPMWKLTTSGIMVELKEDIIKRIGRSPDRGDAACMALIATRKRAASDNQRYAAKRGGSGRSVWS